MPRFGTYRPNLRMVVVNLEAGEGGLSHELTHALVAFDLADAPEWFSEGFASLFESYRISGGVPRGIVNRRLSILQKAVRTNQLSSLESLVLGKDFHGDQEALNYAQARFFCLYLQEQGLLDGYYAQLRDAIAKDRAGYETLQRVAARGGMGRLETMFRRWVTELRSK